MYSIRLSITSREYFIQYQDKLCQFFHFSNVNINRCSCFMVHNLSLVSAYHCSSEAIFISTKHFGKKILVLKLVNTFYNQNIVLNYLQSLLLRNSFENRRKGHICACGIVNCFQPNILRNPQKWQ